MDANFDMIVDDGAEVGVGQASDAVAPISASSLFNAAEVASDLGAVSNMLSMAGANVAPAPTGCGFGLKRLSECREDWRSEMSIDKIRNKQLLLAYSRSIAECGDNAEVVYDEGFAFGVTGVVKSKSPEWHTVSMDIRVFVNGDEEADVDDPSVLEALGIPAAPEMKEFTTEEVIEMMPEAIGYDSSTVDDLEHGDLGAVIQIRQGGLHSKKSWSENCGYLHMEFQGINLDPMSVSDFGNFLYALIHHGEEVALATLHFIYDNAR